MAKVFLICGKLCSGKSTYSKELAEKENAAILSVDEITLSLFGQDAGERLDEYVKKLKDYFFEKSVQIIMAGANVILDWGFWTKAEREAARSFYARHKIQSELHCILIDDDEWKRRIQKRNSDIKNGASDSYYVDEGLLKKFQMIFEAAGKDEVDVLVAR